MDIFYSEKSAKSLKQIAKADKKIAERIIKSIENYAQNPLDVFDIKLLKGEFGDFKRLRVGDYRIIFDEENNVINVYNIKHRKEAYR